MSIRQKKKNGATFLLYGISVALLVIMLFFLIINMGDLMSRTKEESLRNTEEGIRKAAVHCYAIEGQYPESVAYLEENYGLMIDEERYVVHYNCFADNIMPEITVFALEQKEQ